MDPGCNNEGKGCFLIGCGPSLNKTDVRALSDCDSISFNRSYIAWEAWGFDPTYYACFDEISLADNVAEIRRLIESSAVRHFYLNASAAQFGIEPADRITLVNLKEGATFSTDLQALADCGNVGASSLQVLAALGYTRVAMIGIDARYVALRTQNESGEAFVTIDDDPNHFAFQYAKGKRLRARPDLEKLLGQWLRVAEACRRHGMDVRNASPGSALTCFSFMEFEEALSWIGHAGIVG